MDNIKEESSAPECWDQGSVVAPSSEKETEDRIEKERDLAKSFSFLNVDAPPFVPSFAVPGGGTNTSQEPSPSPTTVRGGVGGEEDSCPSPPQLQPSTTLLLQRVEEGAAKAQQERAVDERENTSALNNLKDQENSPKTNGEETKMDIEPPPDSGGEFENNLFTEGEPPADWEIEDNGDSNNGADLEDGSEADIVVKPKKKLIKPEEEGPRKEHVNVVFIGHVDAGKSTIGGQLLYLTGMVEKRTLEKYEREAKEKNRESWYLSWALDTNQEERDKGKTVEVGRAYFETEHKNFTLLDAPGHRSFVPNMIGGACQADLAVLVISARKGEFETGFERGGQTREHAMLAKTAGVRHLVVLVNKMDDPTVEWSEERFNECRDKLIPYLKKCGFNPKTDLTFMPCSGLTGSFLRDLADEKECSWYRGPSFLQYIDELPSLNRPVEGPFRMPVVDKYKDMGTVVLGKVESGMTKRGQQLILMPNKKAVEALQLFSDEDEVLSAASGENIKIKLKGVEEEEVSSGFVLCDANDPCKIGKIFDAQVVIVEHKSIICPGYSAVLHIHAAIEECSVKTLICLIDKKTGEKSKTRPRFVKQDQIAVMRLECAGVICMEPFKEFPQMGRFTLRDEGRTIAIGKVLRVVE